MSYPCSPNNLGKRHRMGGTLVVRMGKKLLRKLVRHPNPDKINFRRTDPRHPKHWRYCALSFLAARCQETSSLEDRLVRHQIEA